MFTKDNQKSYSFQLVMCQKMSVSVYFDNANMPYTPKHAGMYCAVRTALYFVSSFMYSPLFILFFPTVKNKEEQLTLLLFSKFMSPPCQKSRLLVQSLFTAYVND